MRNSATGVFQARLQRQRVVEQGLLPDRQSGGCASGAAAVHRASRSRQRHSCSASGSAASRRTARPGAANRAPDSAGAKASSATPATASSAPASGAVQMPCLPSLRYSAARLRPSMRAARLMLPLALSRAAAMVSRSSAPRRNSPSAPSRRRRAAGAIGRERSPRCHRRRHRQAEILVAVLVLGRQDHGAFAGVAQRAHVARPRHAHRRSSALGASSRTGRAYCASYSDR
jgi:hypothetical protein